MREWLVSAFLLFGTSFAGAQEPSRWSAAVGSTVLINSTGNTAPGSWSVWPTEDARPDAAVAAPTPQPRRRSPYNDADDHGLEVGWSYTSMMFRSSRINANMSGLNTSIVYFLASRLGIEANVTAVFGEPIFDREHSKYASFTGGIKVVGPRLGRNWQLWVHVLPGRVHMFPQTAGKSMCGPGVQAGGGADFHLKSWLSLRFEGDVVRTQLYGQGQNHSQMSIGFVLR
jgi:hypothetical protein